jgi:hypothetical protein
MDTKRRSIVTVSTLVLAVTTVCCATSPAAPITPPRTAVGTWTGVLQATSVNIANTSGASLTVTIIIAQAGPTYAGTCSDGSPIQSFGTMVTGVGLQGDCDGLIFQAVYDMATDRLVNVTYSGGDYSGTLTRK